MRIWNQRENTITDQQGVPRPILGTPGTVNGGSATDFTVGPVDACGRGRLITVYNDSPLTIVR